MTNQYNLRTEEIEYFRHMPQSRSGRAFMRWFVGLLSCVGLAFGIFILIAFVMRALSSYAESGSERLALLVIGILLTSPVFYMFMLIASYAFVMSSDIALEKSGIRLFLAGPWQIWIPSDSLRRAIILPVRYQRYVSIFHGTRLDWKTYQLQERPLRLVYLPSKQIPHDAYAYAVHVPGLTLLHRLAGESLQLRFPIFIVTRNHDRCELLLEKLEQFADDELLS